MSKTKVFILIAFMLALMAGAALGMLAKRSTPRPHGGQSWLVDELQLTAAQERQMHEIWISLMQNKGREFGEQMRALQQEREAAVAELFSNDQRVQYEKINEQFAQRARDLWKQAEQQFLAAAEKTRSILSEAQRPKYDALLEKFRADGASGSWVFGPGARGQMPSTRPAK